MNVFQQFSLVALTIASVAWPAALQVSSVPTVTATGQRVPVATPAALPVKVPSAGQPVVQAKSALVLDLPSNTELFAKDADTQRPIASLTKLMTALLVTERLAPQQVVTIPTVSTGVEESRMGLVTGEQLTVRDLLAGMLISSANDAAEVLAVTVSGASQQFAELMNQRAKQLGMEHTHFENPSGFDAGANYSTARDLAVLARAAVASEQIRSLVGQKELTVRSQQGTEYPLRSTDELLGSYLPIAGLKTGTTDAAGPCLLTLLSSGDRQLLAVVLNSPDRFQENKAMLDWALRSYRW